LFWLFGVVTVLALIPGHLNSKNIVFDVDHRIQIADFSPIEIEQIITIELQKSESFQFELTPNFEVDV
jgi:hypothetical protein